MNMIVVAFSVGLAIGALYHIHRIKTVPILLDNDKDHIIAGLQCQIRDLRAKNTKLRSQRAKHGDFWKTGEDNPLGECTF